MDCIDIKRPVIVKVIMTDAFRHQLISESSETMKRIEDNLEGMMETGKQHPEDKAMQMRIAGEQERLLQLKKEMDWRIRELEAVQNGAELPYRVFEGSVSIAVGDDFADKMTRAEVILKDWKVVEIRKS